MSVTDKHYELVAIEALSLPGPDRRDLVERLLRSLGEEKFDDSENVQIASERLKRIQSGEDQTIPYDEFRSQIRAQHGI